MPRPRFERFAGFREIRGRTGDILPITYCKTRRAARFASINFNWTARARYARCRQWSCHWRQSRLSTIHEKARHKSRGNKRNVKRMTASLGGFMCLPTTCTWKCTFRCNVRARSETQCSRKAVWVRSPFKTITDLGGQLSQNISNVWNVLRDI